MCAIPLRVRADVIGALNLFRASDEAFTDTEMEIAQAMAEIAAIALIQERALREHDLLIEELLTALALARRISFSFSHRKVPMSTSPPAE